MIYHVITPLARYENLNPLVRMLEPHKVSWHVTTDSENLFRIWFPLNWARAYSIDNAKVPPADRCLDSINWLLNHLRLNDDDFYCFLNDDDAYEDGFFEKLSPHQANDVLIVSMKRGDQIPPGTPAHRAHGTNTLVAAPENMRICQVSLEQILIKGRLLKGLRFPVKDCGDGLFIEEVVSKHPVKYVPEANVLFNWFEPGRWNKP